MIEDNLRKLNIKLPTAAAPVGSYVAAKIVGKLLYISGQISIDEKGNLIKGKLGKDLKTEDGYNASKRCALSLIAQAKKICSDDLSKIKSCVKLTGFVNSSDDFKEQPKVEEHLLQSILLKRIGLPSDIGNAVTFLLSERAKYITGQIISVDGGSSIY